MYTPLHLQLRDASALKYNHPVNFLRVIFVFKEVEGVTA
jgi:hypothetical protein